MSDYSWLDDAIAMAVRRTAGIADEVDTFPHICEQGEWRCSRDGVWTGGFWAGILWLAYRQTGLDPFREKAVDFTERLFPRTCDKHNHDLGFMFYPSAVAAGRITGDQRYFDAAKAAALSLAQQFNAEAGFIPGWGFFGAEDWSGSVLIDTVMNLPLLVWAAQQGNEVQLMEVVERQVSTTLRHHLREDGSVYHVYRFDPATGRALGGDTYQGLNAESSWARGQAWAITGLAILASMTGDTGYLKTSEKVADYFLAQLPADCIPPWDFTARDGEQPKDSSASAIAVYGLLRLFEITRRQEHFDTASRLLRALASRCGNGGDRGGLLLHATADLPHGLGVDGSTMYGDYYYFKSLIRMRDIVRNDERPAI